MKRTVGADFAITVGFLVLSVAVLVQAHGWPVRAGLFPVMTGSALLGLSVLKIVLDATRRVPTTAASAPVLVEDEDASELELVDVFATASRTEWLAALSWMAAFFVALWLLGALVAVPLYAVVYLLVASRERIVLAGTYGLVCWIFIYALFDRLLHVPLPEGVIRAAIGM